MTQKDIAELFAELTALYPNIQIKKGTVEAWEKQIGDLPKGVGYAAFMEIIATQQIPSIPAVGRVREIAMRLMGNNAPLVADAWGQVREAIRRDLPESSLHPAIQRAIRGFGGLDGIGYSESIDYIQGQFFKIYDPVAKDEQAQAQLPAQLREFIAGVEVKQIEG